MRLPLLAALIAVADLAAYIGILIQQGVSEGTARPAFVAAYVAAIAASGVGAALEPSTDRRTFVLMFGAVASLSLGFLGVFSIGVPLLGAGAIFLVALFQRRLPQTSPVRPLHALAGGLLALLVLIAGFLLTA